MTTYTVIAGNIGTVITTTVQSQAVQLYSEYVRESEYLHSRAAGESVTLCVDGEPILEHPGTIDK